MNFLAHLFWSADSPQAMVGSLMPDLVRGRLPEGLPAETAAGVRQHRRLDALTDSHAICAAGRMRLRARHGRLAGILLDVLYDHVLARDWAAHHDEPLPRFVARAYGQLRAGEAWMTPAMRVISRRMANEDWLGGYASVDGMRLTLDRLSHRLDERLGLSIDVSAAIANLLEHRDTFTDDLRRYFSELHRLKPAMPCTPGARVCEIGVVSSMTT